MYTLTQIQEEIVRTRRIFLSLLPPAMKKTLCVNIKINSQGCIGSNCELTVLLSDLPPKQYPTNLSLELRNAEIQAQSLPRFHLLQHWVQLGSDSAHGNDTSKSICMYS